MKCLQLSSEALRVGAPWGRAILLILRTICPLFWEVVSSVVCDGKGAAARVGAVGSSMQASMYIVRGFSFWNRIRAAYGGQDWLRCDVFLQCLYNNWWGRFHDYDLKGLPSLVTKIFFFFLAFLEAHTGSLHCFIMTLIRSLTLPLLSDRKPNGMMGPCPLLWWVQRQRLCATHLVL